MTEEGIDARFREHDSKERLSFPRKQEFTKTFTTAKAGIQKNKIIIKNPHLY